MDGLRVLRFQITRQTLCCQSEFGTLALLRLTFIGINLVIWNLISEQIRSLLKLDPLTNLRKLALVEA